MDTHSKESWADSHCFCIIMQAHNRHWVISTSSSDAIERPHSEAHFSWMATLFLPALLIDYFAFIYKWRTKKARWMALYFYRTRRWFRNSLLINCCCLQNIGECLHMSPRTNAVKGPAAATSALNFYETNVRKRASLFGSSHPRHPPKRYNERVVLINLNPISLVEARLARGEKSIRQNDFPT